MRIGPKANNADAFSPNETPGTGQLTLEADYEETRRRPYPDKYTKPKNDRLMHSDGGESTQV